MWHLLYGPNDIARDEEIARMKTRLGDPQIASLNTTLLDAGAAVKDIQAACDAVSFLADRRLVIVLNWLSRTGLGRRRNAREGDDPVGRLIAYLPDLPESTALVLVEDGMLPETHPLLKLAAGDPSHGRAKVFDLPRDPTQWVVERCEHKDATISPAAAQLLCAKINRGDKNDRDHYSEDSRLYLRKLDNELDKLASYAMGRRIEPNDVEVLVVDEEVSDIFKFIDVVSVRDGDSAVRLMRGILGRGESPLVVITMLARQTRLMISAKEYQALPSDQLAQAINVHPFVARKIEPQARRFTMDELVRAHCSIMEADLAIKTGRMDDVTALDTLVAMFCTASD